MTASAPRSSDASPRDPRLAAIERADETPSLAALAAAAGLPAWHFHRVFEGATGVTPKEYAAAHRAGACSLGLALVGQTARPGPSAPSPAPVPPTPSPSRSPATGSSARTAGSAGTAGGLPRKRALLSHESSK
jgi:hypothetical protein